MLFRKSKLIRELREEIQRLRELLAYVSGQRDSAQQGYEGMKEVAEQAVEAAKEKHFPHLDIEFTELTREQADKLEAHFNERRSAYLADPDPFSVRHCPECNVSVRSDSWPQECPACHCTFGFEESA